MLFCQWWGYVFVLFKIMRRLGKEMVGHSSGVDGGVDDGGGGFAPERTRRFQY